MERKLIAALVLSLGLAAPASGAALRLSLEDSLSAAAKASHAVKAAKLEAEAAQARISAARAVMLPRVSLDGSYRWVAEVPSVQLNPKAPAVKFGDNNNYSVGLVANWDLFGSLGSWRQLQVAQALADAKSQELVFQQQALRLRVRLAYFQTQLATAKLRLLADSLNLAQSQANDLDLRLKAGTSSRIDALAASNEELDRRAAFRLAQADLSGALRELFALTGEGASVDLSAPLADAPGQSLPAKVAAPSLVVSLEDPAKLLATLEPAGLRPFDPAVHPRLLALRAQIEAARRAADQAYANHYPRGGVSAKWSQDYPNGPVLENVNQTTLAANLSLPLYSFGAVSRQVDEQVALANAAFERSESAVTDLQRDWLKSHDRLGALKVQRELELQRSAQAETLRDLVYKAYKVGGANYLEVQSSSLRALQAGLELAVTDTQMLIELASLAALTEAVR